MWKQYKRSNIAEMPPYIVGETLINVSVSFVDVQEHSPKEGDMIARNPMNHTDQWLVAKQYFLDNFKEL